MMNLVMSACRRLSGIGSAMAAAAAMAAASRRKRVRRARWTVSGKDAFDQYRGPDESKEKTLLLSDSSRAQRCSGLATSGAAPRGRRHVLRILEALPQVAVSAAAPPSSFPTRRTSQRGGKVIGYVPASIRWTATSDCEVPRYLGRTVHRRKCMGTAPRG